MNYFFNPVNLKQWNMFEKVKKIGHIEVFLATKDMKLNDIMILHVGNQSKNKESGIYAWGIIVKEPYILTNSPKDYCNNKLSVDVKILYINYEEPVIKTSEHKIFNQYRTVHKLKEENISELLKLLPENFFRLTDKQIIDTIKNNDMQIQNNNFTATERNIIAKARIGQGIYKERLVKKFNGECCICHLKNISLLIGSHIKEWANSDIYEKGDINNGLLLCTLHDSLFDKHLITFNKDGNIIFSNKLSEEDKKILNLKNDIHINLTSEMETYMEYHRNKLAK